MSSRVAVLSGSQSPRVVRVPKAVASHVDDAAFLASSYGLVPDEWQFDVLDAWLGETKAGKWAASRCGLAVPRQNGKNSALEVRELYGMVVLGEKFGHTAHEVKTARKAFNRLASFFENERQFPELAALVDDIRKTNGQEAIILTNGGSVEFVARSRGSGRGFTWDVLVTDEAQELSDEQLEALLPTISSAPSGNPQMIVTGTPPGPNSVGEVFTRIRSAGVAGKDRRLAWHEWSVPEGPVDVRDRSLWAATNPALGGRLNVTVVADELEAMSPDGFARERLGQWASASADAGPISPEAWAGRRVDAESAPTDGDVAYAVDMSPDRSRIAVAACRRPTDGVPHVELFRHEGAGRGTAWLVDLLVERWPNASAIVMDGSSPAMSLVPDLSARKVRVTVTGSGDMAKACGMLFDAVRDGKVTNIRQPALDTAVAGAKKRLIGAAGAWGWDRKNPEVDITPLVAVTLALFGAMTTKRRPGRKAKVIV
jgi:hypothetical protein